ncbi:MAG: glycosyltransferase involved in cell wall biosynthesis [Verrucomicrobiales bacterium]|jgi:glycosyltransferase involved in cell wall biosynthesis
MADSALDSIFFPDIRSKPDSARLPKSLLYATSARLGGTGLDTTSLHGAMAAEECGALARVLCYGNQQKRIPAGKVRSLGLHPVRALSCLESKRYYGAKKRYVAWQAARALETGRFDSFHGWSEDCLRALFVARQRKIPTVLDIPTWHRNKGRNKPFETKSEREARARSSLGTLVEQLPSSRQRTLVEYDLADVILVASERAAETFLAAGIDGRRLAYVARGVDVEHYQPATPPGHFRLLFVGALIKRKGVHLLLEAWKKLNLRNAELVLVGQLHDEIKPYLRDCKTDSVTLPGFSSAVRQHFMEASAFVFPSECEGSAKVCYEAAACALPQIVTREAGDVAVHGESGWLIPPNDATALADAIRHFYEHPEKLQAMGQAGRARVIDQFTWQHYYRRVAHAYALAGEIREQR